MQTTIRSLHNMTDAELTARIDTLEPEFEAAEAGSPRRQELGPVIASARKILADRSARRCMNCGSRQHWFCDA